MSKSLISDEPRVSYKEAADILGVDHHYVRILTARGVFEILEERRISPHVIKVFISLESVERYQEAHRTRTRHMVKLTEDEWSQFRAMFGNDKIRGG
jgi:hypothetical protein